MNPVSDLDKVLEQKPRFPGRVVFVAGKGIAIAPLALGAISRHKQLLGDIRDAKFKGIDLIAASEPIITDAIARNYDGWTKEMTEAVVDVESFGGVWSALMNVSGLFVEQLKGEASPVSAAPSPVLVDSLIDQPKTGQASA